MVASDYINFCTISRLVKLSTFETMEEKKEQEQNLTHCAPKFQIGLQKQMTWSMEKRRAYCRPRLDPVPYTEDSEQSFQSAEKSASTKLAKKQCYLDIRRPRRNDFCLQSLCGFFNISMLAFLVLDRITRAMLN